MLKKIREMPTARLVAATLLVMLVTVGALYWFFVVRPANNKDTADDKPKKTVIVTIGDFTTNLALSEGMHQPIIKVSIDLEVENQKAAAAAGKKISQVRDAVLTKIRDTTLLELNGADGMENLRQNLIIVVNSQIRPYVLTDLFFVDMVVQ